jgi:hypothetical protein
MRMTNSRRMRWAAHMTRMEEKKTEHKDLVGKPERGKQFGRSKRR